MKLEQARNNTSRLILIKGDFNGNLAKFVNITEQKAHPAQYTYLVNDTVNAWRYYTRPVLSTYKSGTHFGTTGISAKHSQRNVSKRQANTK